MALKLSPRQLQQLSYLETLPPKFSLIGRVIEQMAHLQADETSVRSMCRQLDEIKAGAGQLGLGAVAEAAGHMVTLARRSGGVQMRVRGMRELLGSMKNNYEGAYRAATTPHPPSDAGEAPSA
ncbi:MAG: hypothetical protein ACHQ2E_03595 [Gemmatimonadales bacterium]